MVISDSLDTKIGFMSLRFRESAEIVADAILHRCTWREFGLQDMCKVKCLGIALLLG